MSRVVNPDTWKSGPDPLMHEWYIRWSKHKAQCVFRKEPYELTWPQFRDIWFPSDGTEPWRYRGRSVNSLCMIRKDINQPWSVDNVRLATRKEQLGLPKTRKPRAKRIKLCQKR